MPEAPAEHQQPRTRKVSAFQLYGEPLLIVLACVSAALALTVNARPVGGGAADFYVFWDSARWFREGADMYLGHPLRPGAGYNLNAPTLVLLFLPLSYLPLVPAHLLFTVIGIIAFWAVGRWVASLLVPTASIVVPALLLLSHPVFSALQLGQPAWLLAIAMTAAWVADREQRPVAAGVLLGIAAAAKPFLGLFGLYALWRDRRMAVAMAGGGLGFVVVGLLVAGAAAFVSWVRVLQHVTWAAHLANASLLALPSRAFVSMSGVLNTTPLTHAPAAVTPLWLAACAAVVGAALWRCRDAAGDVDRAWLLVWTVALLVSPLGWIYYIPVFVGPICVAAVRGTRLTRTLLGASYVLLVVPYSVLQRPLGPVATMTLGSVYSWGLLALYGAALTPWQSPSAAWRRSTPSSERPRLPRDTEGATIEAQP